MPKNKAAGLWSTQFVTALISTSLVLVLLGTIVLFVLTARNLSNYVKETKERALHEQCVDMGTDPSEFLGYNPFTASFEIKLKSEYANNQSLDKIAKQLKATKKVMDVIYQKELMNAVNNNIRKFSIILLIIAALFTYISFALINNTVRLTIFSRRFIINTMKLVGASWGFIRRPFLNQGLLLGILSAIIADAIIIGVVYWARSFEPEINTVIDMQVMTIVGISVLVFGLLITFLCTYFSLSKYLKMNSNELYHICKRKSSQMNKTSRPKAANSQNN